MMNIYKVWYMKPEFFSAGLRGEVPAADMSTHVHLRDVRVPGSAPTDDNGLLRRHLDYVYRLQQGENWSPFGEAKPLIEDKGLEHTSMCAGDVIETPTGDLWLVETLGFTQLIKKQMEVLLRVKK